MIDIDVLVRQVAVYAPQAPEPLVVAKLREAARDWCRVTRLWRQRDALEISADKAKSFLLCDRTAVIHKIMRLTFNSEPLVQVTADELERREPGWQEHADTGNPPRYLCQVSPGTVSLYPRAAGTLVFDMVLIPSRTADQFPEALVDEYGEFLVKGAAAEVLLTPAADFANPQLGADLRDQFARARGAAKAAVAGGKQDAPARVRGRYF